MSQRRRHRRSRSEWSRTRPSLLLSIAVTVCAIGVALWIGGGQFAGTVGFKGNEENPVWQWICLGLAILPWILRMLFVHPPKDEAEAYRTFVRISIIGLSIVVLVFVLSQVVDVEQLGRMVGQFRAEIKTDEPAHAGVQIDTAHVLPTFTLLAVISTLVVGVALPMMAEGMVAIVRYRANRVWRTLSWIYAGLVTLAFVGGQCFPIPLGNVEEFDIGFIPMIVAVAALFPALPLAFRTGWMTNLRRPRKAMIAVAALPTFGSLILTMGTIDEGLFIPTSHIARVVPGLIGIVIGVSIPLLLFATISFIAALFALPSAGAIDRRNDEMGWLARFSGLLMRSLDEGSFVETAISTARDSTGAMAAWFLMEREGGATQLVTGASTGVPIILAERVMEARDEEGNMLRDSASRTADPIQLVNPAPGVGAVAAVPMVQGEERIGVLFAAHRDRHGFDRESLMLLRALADQVALVREHAELVRRSIEQERLEGEMEVARDMQARLLPRIMPESPFYQLSAISQPARIVGGDYYDVVSFADRTLGLVIADVAGKGPGAALYMGMVKGIVQGLSGECRDAAELLRRANVALHGAIDGRWFVTMTCAQVFDHLHRVRVARAGHCPTLVVRSGQTEWVRSRGIGLAIARPALFDSTLELVDLDFAPGDALVLVSDGLPEARSAEGEEFGDDRLAEVVRSTMEDHDGAEGLRDAILSAVRTFTADAEQHDDSTLVVLRWRSGPDLPNTGSVYSNADRNGASLLQSSTSP